MAFDPSSTITLCQVDFDNTYKNQRYFSSQETKELFFQSKARTTLSEYTLVRKTLPNGGVQSRIRVGKRVDELRVMGINYMYYVNENHWYKKFYAFVTDIIYINEGMSELVFEIDVWQTWEDEVTLQPSYVIREHSETDEIGDNTTPEKFNYSDYEYSLLNSCSFLNEHGYLVATTNMKGAEGSRGKQMSGVYQGLYFYYYHNANRLNEFLDAIEEEEGEGVVVFIAVIPKFNVKANSIGINETDKENGEGFVAYSDAPASETISIDMDGYAFTFDGYKPDNNKLYTHPYFCVSVTNHQGQEAEYTIEDFIDRSAVNFMVKGDVSANPSIMLYPLAYRGLQANVDAGISITGFPQCAFNTDTYKLWLAKNQYGMALDTVGNIAQIVGGLALSGTGLGSVAGMPMVVSGAQGILGTFNTNYQMSKEPNKVSVGNTNNNLLTANGNNKFEIYCKRIKRKYAEMIDSYFTMFGYATNVIKVPNISSRLAFNYVQTSDVNITGNIPHDDLKRIKQMFNEGVTFWKNGVTVGNYSITNTPIKKG